MEDVFEDVSEKEIELLIKVFDFSTDVFQLSNNLEIIKNLLVDFDVLFIAKVSLYAHNKLYLSFTPLYISALISSKISGKKWAKDYYYSLVQTPMDMVTIINCFNNNKIKVTNAVKKGFAKAFNNFDDNQLIDAGKEIIDIIKIVHPKSNFMNEKSLNILMNMEQIKLNEFIKENYKTTISVINNMTL